jgi:hypothetical protein
LERSAKFEWNRVSAGLAVALLFTLPAPVYFIFCLGALPFAVQAAHAFRYGPDLAFVISALVALGICGGLAWLVCRMFKARIIAYVVLPLVLALGAIPIQTFDCMDGGNFVPCSAYRLYAEMVRNTGVCGDSWPRRQMVNEQMRRAPGL